MTEQNDRELVAAHLAGDKTALETLILRYLKPIYGFLFYYTTDAEASSDLTQETFIKVWCNLKQFQPDKKFKTWLFTIAKNTALDWLKKKKAVPFSQLTTDDDYNPLDNLPDPRDLPDAWLAKQEIGEELQSALQQLPAHYREVLLLYYYQQFSLTEIAEMSEQNINTVKSRHRRALQALEKILKNSLI